MGIVIVLMALGIVLFAVKFGMAAEKKVDTSTTTKLSPLDAAILKYSRKYGVPIPIIQAIIEIESSYRQYAKNLTDPSYGYMGIMPIVAQDYGIVNDWTRVTTEEINSIYEVDNNIGCGTKLLHHLLLDHNLATAVEMYNVGETGWNKGRRNSNYVSNFFAAYDKYNK